MRIDISALSKRAIRHAMRLETLWSAERKGRELAFDDLHNRGFAAAYRQSEVMDGFKDSAFEHDPITRSVINAFSHGYRQAVLGYWMAEE